jgi:hypothetical protein
MANLYNLLKVSPTASEEEIKKAINQELRVWSNRTNAPQIERRKEAERMLNHLEDAKRILLDAAKRKQYDLHLQTTPAATPRINEGVTENNNLIVSHSLGYIGLNEKEEPLNIIVIKRRTHLPCNKGLIFNTQNDKQSEFKIIITEGEGVDPDYVTIVGEASIKIPSYPKGAPVELSFEYDPDAIIHITVFDLTANKFLGEMHIERKSNLKDHEVEDMKQTLSKKAIN